MEDQKKRNQKGFTLIEIIAVLVILGLLAAVAIPKYQDLKVSSANQAVQAAIAAGVSQAAMAYSNAVLAASKDPLATAITALGDKKYTTLGDYLYTYAANKTTDGILVTVTGATTGTKGEDVLALTTVTPLEKDVKLQ